MRGLSATVMFRHGLIPLTIRNHVFGTIPGRTSAFLKSIRRIDSGFGAFKKSSLIPGGVTERRSSLPFRSESDVALTVRVALIVSLVVVLFAAFNWLTARQLFRLHPRRKGIVIALLIAGNGMWLFLPWLRVRSDAMRLIRATLGPPWFAWLCFAIVYSAVIVAIFVAWLLFARRVDFVRFARRPSRVFLWTTLVALVAGVWGALVPLRVGRVPIAIDALPSAAPHHLRNGARAASRPRLPRGRPRRRRSDLRAEAPRGRRRARPGRPRDRRPRQSRDVRRPGRDDRAPARQPRAAPRQRRRGHARPLARRHLRLPRAAARAETELRRGAGRARRATAARPRAPAARVSRRRRAGDSAHALRALARRAVRLPPAALVAGRALHPVPHGPLPPRRVAAVRAHRRRLPAGAVAPRHHAGDRADRTASSAALSVAPHAASIFIDARASPRVGPTLTMAMGMPRSAARLTKRKPDQTASDEPATSSASASSTCSIATATLRGGTASPKKTTAGLSTPPQRSQGGTTKVSSS